VGRRSLNERAPQKHMGSRDRPAPPWPVAAQPGCRWSRAKLGTAPHTLRTAGMMVSTKTGCDTALISPPAFQLSSGHGRGRARTCWAEDPGTEPGNLGSDLVIDAGLATVMTVHVLPGSRGEEPVHDRGRRRPRSDSQGPGSPGAEASMETAKLLDRSLPTMSSDHARRM